jgi:hypothetical protein
MTPSALFWSPHFGHGVPVALDADELQRKRSNTVPVPISCPPPLVKWITIPSPTYIPAILHKNSWKNQYDKFSITHIKEITITYFKSISSQSFKTTIACLNPTIIFVPIDVQYIP